MRRLKRAAVWLPLLCLLAGCAAGGVPEEVSPESAAPAPTDPLPQVTAPWEAADFTPAADVGPWDPAAEGEKDPGALPEPEPAEAPEAEPAEAPEPESAEAPEAEPAETPEPEPAETPEPEPAEAPEPEPAEAPEPEPAEAPESEDVTYFLRVNDSCNVVNVYAVGETEGELIPVKAMLCSTGEATPQEGTYALGGKWEWLGLFGDVYGLWATHITGQILFHSVPYLEAWNHGSLEYWEYDQLGTSCSMGCVRLKVVDAKWIYDNAERITGVEFYHDEDPGPFGKPAARKISSNEVCRGWDPTDPDPENPWLGQPANGLLLEPLPE